MVQIPYKNKPGSAANRRAKPKRKAALIHHVLLNKVLRIALMLFVGIAIPVLVFLIIFTRTIGPLQSFPVHSGTCSHPAQTHVPCGRNLTASLCAGRGCCFSPDLGCYHYFPAKHQYLRDNSTGVDPSAAAAVAGRHVYPLTRLSPTSAFGFSMQEQIVCVINEISRSRLGIIIARSEEDAEMSGANEASPTAEYYFETTSPIFYISVFRKETGKLILSTYRGALAVTLNYVEWSFYLGSSRILIGLGSMSLRPGFRRTLVTDDKHPNVPFILAFDPETQTYHGVYLKSQYPIEVEVTDSYLIILRGIYDNRSFSIELLVGDDIASVQADLRRVMGWPEEEEMRSMPSPLQYGFHICDAEEQFSGDYYKVAADLEQYLQPEVLQVLPYDSHCLTERISALNKSLPDEYLPFYSQFKMANKSVLLTVVLGGWPCQNSGGGEDCDSSLFNEVALRSQIVNEDSPYRMQIGRNKYIAVDWASDRLTAGRLDDLFHSTVTSLNLGFDGIVLQANWLQDDRLPSAIDTPLSDLFPYAPIDYPQIAGRLVPWNARHAADAGVVLRNVNVFGGAAVRLAGEHLRQRGASGGGGRNLFLSSESSSPPLPNVNILLRRINATWEDLHSIKEQILCGSLTGLHSINANICGDKLDSRHGGVDEELCLRWYQFAALTPLYRTLSHRAPLRFALFYRRAIARVTRLRYSLASYFHTARVLQPARPQMVPLLFDYPAEVAAQLNGTEAVELNSEVVGVGPALLAVPVIRKSQHVLELAPQPGGPLPVLAYEFNDGAPLGWNNRSAPITLSIVPSDLPLFVKARHIVPIHEDVDSVTTVAEARAKPLLLIVALQPTTDTSLDGWASAEAHGALAIDERTIIEFSAVQNGTLVTVLSRLRIIEDSTTGVGGGGDDNNNQRTDKCGEKDVALSTTVAAIKWFGVQYGRLGSEAEEGHKEDAEEEEEGLGQGPPRNEGEAGNSEGSSGSVYCQLEESDRVDLCAEDLQFTLDVSSVFQSAGDGQQENPSWSPFMARQSSCEIIDI